MSSVSRSIDKSAAARISERLLKDFEQHMQQVQDDLKLLYLTLK